MFTLFTVLIILASIVLILIVLVQNSKGGGLSSTFGSANQFGGVVQTNKFLEKATWSLAIALLVLSVGASVTIPGAKASKENQVQEYFKNFEELPVVPSDEQYQKQLKDQEDNSSSETNE